jgi:hypothetical protein
MYNGIGNVGNFENFNNGSQYGGDYVSGLPNVSDPDAAFAQITRDEYIDYVNNYRQFEEDLLDRAQNDTSLIDDARTNAQNAQGLMSGIADRNATRYGVNLTPAQRQEQSRGLDRANNLGLAQSVNDARIAQREANQGVISDLINIGQGINRSSLSQMQGAAQSATQRNNAFTQAKAASKAQTYSTIGSLASAAIFAFAF